MVSSAQRPGLHATVPVLLTALTAGVAWMALQLEPQWELWRPATCMPDACFCEAVHPGAMRQPSNAWSNLGFCLVGLLVAARGWRRGAASALSRASTVTFGIAVWLIGSTSLFFHASLSFVGQFFDVLAMYLLSFFLLAHNLRTLAGWGDRRFLLAYVGAVIGGGVVLVTVPEARRYLFGLSLLAVVITEVLVRRRKLRATPLTWMGVSLALLALAFFIWTMDISHRWCEPHSLWQGHAAWHLLCAVASGAAYLYYDRSER